MDKIVFHGDQEDISLYVLDSTKLAGRSFLLVTDTEEGDGTCYILEEHAGTDDKELVYEMVEDDTLLDHLASIFGEQTEDVDIEF
nr:DUF1292 domain-containing protein [Lachnospiraceae bacterium]